MKSHDKGVVGILLSTAVIIGVCIILFSGSGKGQLKYAVNYYTTGVSNMTHAMTDPKSFVKQTEQANNYNEIVHGALGGSTSTDTSWSLQKFINSLY